MAVTLRGISEALDWVQVLKVLEISIANNALPQQTKCPFCAARRLSVYADDAAGGTWCACEGCGYAGTLLDLAADVWKIAPSAALARLQRRGISVKLRNTQHRLTLPQRLTEEYAHRKRFNDFYSRARRYYRTSPTQELARLKKRFGLQTFTALAQWEDGPSHLVGAAKYSEIERVYAPSGDGRDKRVQGHHWRDAIVIPYHNLPKRLCGFFIAGKEAGPGECFYRGIFHRPACRELPDAGLAGTWSLRQRGPLPNDAILLADPFLMLRLQIEHLSMSRSPLPLVAFHDDASARTREAWNFLNHRRPVLWCEELTVPVLHQAIQLDGSIAVSSWRGGLGRPPRDFAYQASRLARPWQDVLRDWASGQTPEIIADTLKHLEDYGHAAELFVAIAPEFAESRPHVHIPRTAKLGTTTIVEQNDQWLLGNKQGLLSNSVLRIDQVIHNRKGNYQQYRGRLIHAGETVPVRFGAKHIPRLNTVLLQLLLQERGKLFWVLPGWAGRLFSIAILFHTPEIVSE